jgi:hypothetical protein
MYLDSTIVDAHFAGGYNNTLPTIYRSGSSTPFVDELALAGAAAIFQRRQHSKKLSNNSTFLLI